MLRRLATPRGGFDRMCHREECGDLAFPELANRQKRDCRAALAMTRLFVLGWQTDKIEIATQARNDNTPVIARNVAISAVQRWQTEKGEIAALRSQ